MHGLNLIYDTKYSFYQYCNIKNFISLSLISKHGILLLFYSEFQKQINSLNSRTRGTKYKRENIYDDTPELYNDYLRVYFNQHMIPFLVDTCNYDKWFENEEWNDTERRSDKEESNKSPLEGVKEESNIPATEDDEEVKGEKRLKILTSNKLLTRLQILLPQIKTGNNSYTLKNEIRKILYLSYQHNKITKKVCSHLMKSL